MRPSLFSVILTSAITISAVSLQAQSLSVFSGNGQLVLDQFVTSVPLVVLAKDAAGRPAAGVSVAWSITQGMGTLVNAMATTDANGNASTNFLGSLAPGSSFAPTTVTAASALGSANFVVTTSISRQNGGLAAPPLVELITPPIENRTISGRAGSTLPGALVVRVTAQSGTMAGQPVPNIAVQIVSPSDASLPSATCNGPGGIVLTDMMGIATCDLVLGPQSGTNTVVANVGGFANTPFFTLQVTPGVPCTYSITPATQSFGVAGGTGTVSVIAPAGCGWTASSNASWIVSLSGVSGNGNGTVGYSVSANAGAARSGTLLIAGQIFTANQSGVGSGSPALLITTGSNLPAGTVNATYMATLGATGGATPYTWSASGSLPAGFTLSPAGIFSGVPSVAGNYNFAATVTDSAGHSQTQPFSFVVASAGSNVPTITNSGFPSGVVGQPYQQALTSSGGCTTPFSPVPVFSLAAGALPAGLSVQMLGDRAFGIAGTPTAAGTSNFTLAVQDACGVRTTAAFAITIVGAGGAALTATPASLAFTVQAGSGTVPPAQTVTIASTGAATQYTVAAATVMGGNWLVVDQTSGTTPGVLAVSIANFGMLAIGSYDATITIASGVANNSVSVPVRLTIIAPPILIVNPAAIAFTQPASGGAQARQAIAVTSGGAPAHFTATASTTNGGPWLFLNTNSGDTPATVTAIVNAAGLAPGAYTGSIVISAGGSGAQTVAVNLTVTASAALTVSPTSLSFVTPAIAGAPATQNVAVSSTAGPAAFTVTSSVASGPNWLVFTPLSGTTPANLAVSVNAMGLAVGSYQASLIVTAADPSIPPVTVNVSLTVGQAAPLIRAITNAASFAPGPIAPGEIVTLFGDGLGPFALATAAFDRAGNVATLDGGTQVLFDGIAAPVIYTSANQVSVIVPYGIFGRDAVTLQTSFNGLLSNVLNLRVADAAPAIFTLTNDGQGAIINADGTTNFPQSGADAGSYVSIFATGEGQTDPPGVDGKLVTPAVLPRPRLLVSVQINGEPVEVLYAGGAPGLAAGLLQVNARVPADLAHGSRVTVVLTVGTQSSPAVFMSVR